VTLVSEKLMAIYDKIPFIPPALFIPLASFDIAQTIIRQLCEIIDCSTINPHPEKMMNPRICYLFIFALSGCANLSTISRVTEFPNVPTAIHLDSTQRLVYRGRDEEGYLCAEPTPDALQSYANAFGGSLTPGGKDAASISNAFAVNAMGVGLHTQSITLMRDMLYRICEAAYNRRVEDIDVHLLLQRAQDLTLAVLAIEQLTGVVAARQPMVVNTTSASAAADINDYHAQLDIARRAVAAKKAALETATTDEDNAKQALTESNSLLLAETAKSSDNQSPEKITELKNQISALQISLTSKASAKNAADLAYQDTAKATHDIEALDKARLNTATVSTGGRGFMNELNPPSTIDKTATKEIAEATVKIVETIVRKEHLTDSCMSFYSQIMSNNKHEMDKSQLGKIYELCNKVIQADIDRLREHDNATSADTFENTPTNPPREIRGRVSGATAGVMEELSNPPPLQHANKAEPPP
jgi:hypothetical protein